MLDNGTTKEVEKQVAFYRDRNGRAWKLIRLAAQKFNCYRLSCNKRGFYEMLREGPGICRRELLCVSCFEERKKAWGLTYIETKEVE